MYREKRCPSCNSVMIGEFSEGIVMYRCPTHEGLTTGKISYFPIEVSDEMAEQLKENARKAWSQILEGIKPDPHNLYKK